MSYNQDDDKLIKLFEYEYEKGSLQFSLFSYKGQKPKLQIHRMYKKIDDTMGYGKMGRLDQEEMKYFISIADEIDEIITNFEIREE